MARSSGSPSSPIHAQNSPRNRSSRRSRGVLSPSNSSPPPLSLSGTSDQEQFPASSSSPASDSFSSKEVTTIVTASSSLAVDDSGALAGGDALPDNSDNGGAAKKPAWNKPSNGATVEVSAVMGAESWPALSESARASPKSSSTNSLKLLSVPEKEAGTSISTLSPSSNHVAPTRQRSMKRGGGNSNQSSMPANGSSSQATPAVEVPPQSTGKSGGSSGESYRDVGHRGGSYGGKDSSFRGNNGPQPRGDGSYHHGHGGRRDPHRSFGSRENHAPQQRVDTRPFLRGPAANAPFVPPPPPPVAVRPFVAPMVYTEVPSPVFYVPGPHPDAFRTVPMVPVSPVFLPMPDPHLPSRILNQIDYYFSNENLVKDTFLRQNMDSEGWVPVKLIAGFKKVMQLTDNIQLILDAIQASNVVEVQGDKVRRKIDWMKWIMPPVQYGSVTTSQSIGESSQDMLATHLNSVTLDETAAT
ncbi:RNA-binding protein LARP/SRO9 [Handroanthus impetiginosus]|uniref:RNA-binding protein LARP/SRO9 n=1 Tax=Handroanthus impetiginosus TaxID=429701 RepID=A0A2G9GWB9_9LAMI|nr:RNA-binding protein LARP/SRO9 [Handroanthus impetiginosus]